MKYSLLTLIYRISHPSAKYDQIPSWWKRSLLGQIWHSLRKFICQNIAPNCVTNFMRVNLYRLCGFKIGKRCFIGMKCYFDDLCVDKITIGNHVTISYGVYFTCHSPMLAEHCKLTIEDEVYVGMRASIVATKDMVIEEGAIIGAMCLVNKNIPAKKTVVGVPCRILEKEICKI